MGMLIPFTRSGFTGEPLYQRRRPWQEVRVSLLRYPVAMVPPGPVSRAVPSLLPLPADWEVASRFRGFPRGASETRRLATLPSGDLRQLVRARSGGDSGPAGGRLSRVRAGARRREP